MLTRLGEAGADAFIIIMRIAGHSSVTVSQRYVHPTPEGMERAFERLEDLNAAKFDRAEAEAKAAGASSLSAKVPTSKSRVSQKSSQVVQIKQAGPLAQRLEQRTHNPLVEGSNPSGPTKGFKYLQTS